MNHAIDLDRAGMPGNVVYVRRVDHDELPDDLRAEVRTTADIYSVHNASGDRLALVAGKRLAFSLAREHDMTPMSVH